MGSNLTGKNLLFYEQFFPLRVIPFEKATSHTVANRKSQEVFPFVKMAKKKNMEKTPFTLRMDMCRSLFLS